MYFICTPFTCTLVLQYILVLMFHVTVHMRILLPLCVHVCVYPHMCRKGHVGQTFWLAPCPHLFHCHHVCCVDVPTPSSLHPQMPLWEQLTPLIPRHGHTQYTDSNPIKSYTSPMEVTLINMIKNMIKTRNQKHWRAYLNATWFILLSLLQISNRWRHNLINMKPNSMLLLGEPCLQYLRVPV